jgi:hypothetical protein
MTPATNGDLDTALHVTKAAWATCAAKVDMIFDCQAKRSTSSASIGDNHD